MKNEPWGSPFEIKEGKTSITTHNPEQFEEVIALSKAGKIRIQSLTVGRHNASWIFSVEWIGQKFLQQASMGF